MKLGLLVLHRANTARTTLDGAADRGSLPSRRLGLGPLAFLVLHSRSVRLYSTCRQYKDIKSNKHNAHGVTDAGTDPHVRFYLVRL